MLPDPGNGKRITIESGRLILAEGKDALHFLAHACTFYRNEADVQVIDFGGISQLTSFLKILVQKPEFRAVVSLLIVRDAEGDFHAAFTSVQTSLIAIRDDAGLAVPDKAFAFSRSDSGGLRCAIAIFPGPGGQAGTLEDLCLRTVQTDPVLVCAHKYLEEVQGLGRTFSQIHKNRLHAFLAGRDRLAGKPIGLAFKAGAWDPDHEALSPFKALIRAM